MKSTLRWLGIATTGVVLAGCASTSTIKTAGTGASFKGPVGLQLYSLRDQFKQNVTATLDQVKADGIRYVELAGTYNASPEQFKAMLTERGITAISGHFAFEKFRDDPAGVAKEAEALGLKYAGCAWIPHTGDFDEKTCREAAAVFNKAGMELGRHGIKFFYHTHGYEFQKFKEGTLFDLLMKETEPSLVSYEMDIFWIVHPGQSPAGLLDQYGSRFALMHLKDMKKGTPTGLLTGHTEVTNDVALGTGQIDLPPILKAARKAGVKWYFIEDESPTSEKQIPVSLNYLENVSF